MVGRFEALAFGGLCCRGDFIPFGLVFAAVDKCDVAFEFDEADGPAVGCETF